MNRATVKAIRDLLSNYNLYGNKNDVSQIAYLIKQVTGESLSDTKQIIHRAEELIA